MAEVVDASEIEHIVGAKRGVLHKSRAYDSTGQVFILHSHGCLALGDLLACPYTKAMEQGIDIATWRLRGWMEVPVIVGIHEGTLIPLSKAAR